MRDIMKLRNPEGPEAADEIEWLRAERDIAAGRAERWDTEAAAAKAACKRAEAERDALRAHNATLGVSYRETVAERDRLRAALEMAADCLHDVGALHAWAAARAALEHRQ